MRRNRISESIEHIPSMSSFARYSLQSKNVEISRVRLTFDKDINEHERGELNFFAIVYL